MMNRCLGSWLLLLFLPVQAGFVLRNGFSAFLNQQFSNLTQLKNQTSSLSKELVTQNAMRGLWALIGPHLGALPGCCKKPFSSNCSVFFDAEINQIVCDAQFEEVRQISKFCEAEQPFPAEYLTQLHKSNILQARIIVGLAPVQHPQVMYWLYDKLPSTLSQSVTQSNSMSGHSTQTDTDSVSRMNNSTTGSASSTISLTESLLSSRSVSLSQTVTQSITPSDSVATDSANLSHSLSTSDEVVWNPEWANWQVTTGVYRDNANQTGRYLESVPGVITDRMTGLQWQKVGSAPASNWTAAQAYCADLLESGFGDWRLPTHVELQTLVDYTMDCAGPCLDLNFFPGTQTSSYYWSSDALQGYPGSAWWVSYGNGSYYAGLVCSQGYGGCSSVPASGFTRCVRPSSADREIDRYTFNNTQVLDTVTGLIWQRTVSGTYNWSSAQAYCAGLNLDGLSWRLPNVKELSTLLDVRVASPGPTMNTTAFPSTPQSWFWTSTPYSCTSPSGAWVVYFGYGNVSTYGISPPYYVRCVR
ncbi:MAG: DUF1566 domain-containing protein [Myxococcaceae bacterium]|nr:DUF1566 domain-containing protein [Myxococcaceae bacterium]